MSLNTSQCSYYVSLGNVGKCEQRTDVRSLLVSLTHQPGLLFGKVVSLNLKWEKLRLNIFFLLIWKPFKDSADDIVTNKEHLGMRLNHQASLWGIARSVNIIQIMHIGNYCHGASSPERCLNVPDWQKTKVFICNLNQHLHLLCTLSALCRWLRASLAAPRIKVLSVNSRILWGGSWVPAGGWVSH